MHFDAGVRAQKIRPAMVEPMERRALLAVSAAEYDAIRGMYPEFSLPADMADVNVIEIAPADLSMANLRSAISSTLGTTLPNLIVARTTDTQNWIGYATEPQMGIYVPTQVGQGALSIVGFGTQPLTLDAERTSGVLAIGGSAGYRAVVNLGGMTITGGRASEGAGILVDHTDLTLKNVTIIGNTAFGSVGGGIEQSYGNLVLTNVTINGNTAAAFWGGGGLCQYYGTSTLTNVTISGNTAGEGTGGGMANVHGTATLTNVTISGNTAGGFYQWNGSTIMTNVTISRNFADSGGGIYEDGGLLTLNNTIVAGNVAGLGPDLYRYDGTLDGQYNLIGDGVGQSALVDGIGGNQVGTTLSPIDPLLTQGAGFGTGLAPMPGSPAIDAGSESLIPSGLTTDIYGQPRNQGTGVNIGAVESTLGPKAGVAYAVTSLSDVIAADGVVTFREAFEAANQNLAVGDAPAGSYSAQDQILFAPGLTGTVHANGRTWFIDGSLAIQGSGASALTFDGDGMVRVLRVGPYPDVSLRDLTIRNGWEDNVDGGGIAVYGAAVTLSDLAISGNSARRTGGGLYLRAATSTLRNVIISGNVAQNGGGVYQSGGSSTLVGVQVNANRASNIDGTYYLAGAGGGLLLNGPAALVNVTVAGNSAGAGGGVAAYQHLVVDNSIIAGNLGGDLYCAPNSSVAGHNSLIGNGTGQSALVNGANGNLVGTTANPINPQFVSVPPIYSGDWDLHLRPTSPAVNAGNNTLVPAGVTTDLYGIARIQGGTVDMGAYELDQAPTLSSVSINNGAIQRSMVKRLDVVFSEPVSLSASAIQVLLSTGAAPAGTALSVANPSGDQKTYLLTFSGPAVIGGSLPDGIYDLIISATGVQDLTGNPLTASYTQRFHRLFGDSDGNRTVNALDYARLKQTFGRAPTDPLFNSAFDYEGNNLINALDLARFRQRYGMSYSY